MIKYFLYVEDGSVVNGLEGLENEVKVITYRKGGVKPVLEKVEPISTEVDKYWSAKEVEFKKTLEFTQENIDKAWVALCEEEPGKAKEILESLLTELEALL